MVLLHVCYGADLAQAQSTSRPRSQAGVSVRCNPTGTAALMAARLQLPAAQFLGQKLSLIYDTTEQRFRRSKQTCVSSAAVILLKAQAIFLYKTEKSSSIQCFAIISLTALVNISMYYRLL